VSAAVQHAEQARSVQRLIAAGIPQRSVLDALDVLAAQDDQGDPCRIEGRWAVECALCGGTHPCDC
jgi:hypothetical protein